ncbi:hypothetical protein EYF80_066821 [Liparis tanakae]|uniref:Secreted protein n=1 Tax=Liparis tanakae TaxID=230148 RepID=A0A4Z2E3W3_9TELE|nr:hypothetical protein EYF80_066821 [Liparis tanakae]
MSPPCVSSMCLLTCLLHDVSCLSRRTRPTAGWFWPPKSLRGLKTEEPQKAAWTAAAARRRSPPPPGRRAAASSAGCPDRPSTTTSTDT